MSDGAVFIVLVTVEIAASILLARWFATHRSRWSIGKTVWLSASPVPILIGGLCLLIALDAGRAMIWSPETCGVDACGMAFAFSLICLLCCLAVYILGAASAWLIVRR